MNVKRWALLIGLGVALFGWGLAIALQFRFLDQIKYTLSDLSFALTRQILTPRQVGALLMGVGTVMVAVGVRFLNKSLLSVLSPVEQERLVDVLFTNRTRRRGVKIVALGGGTGLSTILRGLKDYTSNLTVAVTVTDDGGSSGLLRQQLGVPPPGDLRNCLVALADAEPAMKELMQYRFENGELKGQNFGNLLISALYGMTGDIVEAVRRTSQVLAVAGEVLPSTRELVTLRAQFEDGSSAEGETAIVKQRKRISRLELSPHHPRASDQLLRAVAEADMILLGPGSLYTSILPHLLLPEVAEAIRRARGIKVYVCNVMTQPGETEGFTASDHARTLLEYGGRGILDVVLVNERRPSDEVLDRYRRHGQDFVQPDAQECEKLGVRVICGDFIDEKEVVRHHVQNTARALIALTPS